MNKENFIQLIKQVVSDSAINGTIENLEDPPGCNPSKDLLELSSWYLNLPEHEQNIVKKIVTDSVNEAVFGFMCVLDGVRKISDSEKFGKLSLTYHEGQDVVELNDEHGESLHDIYNTE